MKIAPGVTLREGDVVKTAPVSHKMNFKPMNSH